MIRTSKLTTLVQPSATLAAGAKAKQLRATGVEVFDLSLGEPDFDTPKHIQQAATQAMIDGQTHYTPAGGTAELKAVIAKWYGDTYSLAVKPENVLISNGAKHSIHTFLAATVGPGDDVIIPAPYWVSYSDLVAMTGARPVILPTTLDAGFKLSVAQLQAAITPNTRLLMLNSPSNPTGAVYTRGELDALVNCYFAACDGAILSDEIYEQLVYGDVQATCTATLGPTAAERVVTISGVSKSYAMTGWRIGWTVAPANVIKAMDTIQSQETSCPSSISQAAAAAALSSPESPATVAAMRKEFAVRRDLTGELLGKIPNIKYRAPDGAFYAFFDVSAYFGKTINGTTLRDSVSFCTALLEQTHVNMVPGAAFGAEGFVRMSFACSQKTIQAALERLHEWLKQA